MWWQQLTWKRLREKSFDLEYPRNWAVRREDGFVHLSPKRRSVHLMVAAFTNPDATLEQFAETKLTAQADTFPASGPRIPTRGRNWAGIRHESDDIRPERESNTRRVVVCAGHGDLYVTVSLYLNPKEFEADRATYERILNSLEFTS